MCFVWSVGLEQEEKALKFINIGDVLVGSVE